MYCRLRSFLRDGGGGFETYMGVVTPGKWGYGDQVGGESVYFFISLFTGLTYEEHNSDGIVLIIGLYGFSLLCLEIQFILMRIVVLCARVIVCEVT